MFIVALLTVAKIGKQPKCPLTGEWIKKMWYMCVMEYYLALIKKEVPATCNNTDEAVRH